jgi:hypothetical protein
MSDTSQGPGWWQASDGKWYPPEQAPGGPTPGAMNYGGTNYGSPVGGGGVDIGGAISYGWNKFTQNAGPLIAAVVLIVVINGIVSFVGNVVDSLLLRVIVQIIGIVVSAVISFGLVNVSLKIVRGEQAEINDIFPSGPMVVPYAITGIIVSFVTSIGFVLCIIPGVIAATFLLFAHFVVIDEGLQPGDAIKRSIDLVKPNFGGVLGFIVVAGLVNLVGFILCCIGALATIPLTTVAGAKVYKGLKGEGVAP